MTEYPKASQVIATIQALIDGHGDLPTLLFDPDSKDDMPIGVEYVAANPAYDTPVAHFTITASYGGNPSGYVDPTASPSDPPSQA